MDILHLKVAQYGDGWTVCILVCDWTMEDSKHAMVKAPAREVNAVPPGGSTFSMTINTASEYQSTLNMGRCQGCLLMPLPGSLE